MNLETISQDKYGSKVKENKRKSLKDRFDNIDAEETKEEESFMDNS